MTNFPNKPLSNQRGYLNLNSINIQNLHPKLNILEKVPYKGLFDLDNKIFFIDYGDNFEYSVLTRSVDFLISDITKYIEGKVK